MKRSIFLISFGSMKSSARKSGTCPAMRDAKASIFGKRSIFRIPDCPATSACQFFSRPTPKGVTRPKPVTTTLRCSVAPTVNLRFVTLIDKTVWGDGQYYFSLAILFAPLEDSANQGLDFIAARFCIFHGPRALLHDVEYRRNGMV